MGEPQGSSVTLKAITKNYGETKVVKGVDLRIEPGELFFLLGPSGCGKTTLLRMIAGLITPTSGQIFFDNQDVTELPTQKRGTAMVFQGYALWPHMSVAKNVAFGLDVRKTAQTEKSKRVTAALAATGMQDYAERKPSELSGGQQQRVALARALVVEPSVLLLDEPLSNLDAKLRHRMRSEIRRICHDAGITAVYVTHDQEEALSMADRIAVMHNGVIAHLGTPKDVYNLPANRFVADFLGQTNFVEGTIKRNGNGRVTLETDAGPLSSTVFPDEIRDGQRAVCSIRPEAIRILTNGSTAENELSAKHLETVYLGYAAQHVVEVAGPLTLRTHEQKPTGYQPRGDNLRIGIDPADVVILRDKL